MIINETQKSKIEHFLNDEVLSKSVKDVITNSFLKPKPNRDVYQLAASRIAIDLLEEAWKDLEKCQSDTDKMEKVDRQVGL